MEGIRVLLVDDDEDFRTVLAERLRMRQLETMAAGSGPEAIAAMQRQPFDVVVLDLRMPGMDGIEALRQIKEIQPRVEVVLLTGHASMESGIEGMRLGAFDYLVKPCEIEELISKIQDACRKSLGEEAGEA
ncbi:MAG: hypothetical protein A2521_16440 [Deltaproteobacteria bacterium RIFOXYD12_FULL_57_12]|nr:MAG: hypothetical protein A2521_16440 [Deltaproteobacteria bacterium RIFOXYD12_FULL_57_12]